MMGSQEPSERIAPEYRATDGPDAVRILRAGGTVLDPWQSDILDDWMGRTVSGKWTAPTAGGSVPRQNGKSLLVQGRAARPLRKCGPFLRARKCAGMFPRSAPPWAANRSS